MDQFCHYVEAIDPHGAVKSNGTVFFVNHRDQSHLLTAAHTLRNYNDFIYPDFHRWHALYVRLNGGYVPLFHGNRNPIFRVYPKDHKELLDAVSMPFSAPAGPIDFDYQVGEPVKLCGWRKQPNPVKFVLDSRILSVTEWDMCIDLTQYSSMQRSGMSGGAVYTERGFVGVYYADDIGKPTSHAVCLKHMFK